MTPPARIHLLPAKEAPITVIVRRKPSRQFHMMTWNTETDAIEHGSWFAGKLYGERSDVSFDGEWMVYFATGANGMNSWTGVCRAPRLKTVWDFAYHGLGGGGFWRSRSELILSCRTDDVGVLEQRWSSVEADYVDVLAGRLERDGWRPAWPTPEVSFWTYLRTVSHSLEPIPWWTCQPTPEHPVLRLLHRHYRYQHTSVFALDRFPSVLGTDTDWATWDARGQLLVARAGAVERWTLRDLGRGTPTTRIDFEGLVPGIRS